jgi:CBS domain-containing protein
MTATPKLTDGLRVADLMTIDPVTIDTEATLDQAMELMRGYRIAGLPVVDHQGSLVGVISHSDLVSAAASPLVGRVVRGQPDRLRVGELMSHPAITVRLGDPLVDAARLMVDRHIHRVVAVDEAGRPVGVLSAMDFVGLFATG